MNIELIKGDITKIDCEAIVNAANNSLLGGGGVDGAIHRAGGPTILEQCRQIRSRQGSCPTGEAVYTSAGNLPAKYVIHTVGPVWSGGKNNEEILLTRCYENSLLIAEKLKLKCIAFPNISTGIFGYPKREAAAIAINTVKGFPTKNIEKILFVCYDQENYIQYEAMLSNEIS